MKICGFMKTTLLDYPGHVACTVFTGGCNFRCPYCHNSELLDMDLPSEFTEEEIFMFLQRRKGVLEGVVISGGEPTLQPDLPRFIRDIKEQTGLEVKLDTNGTAPDILRELLGEGLLDFVSMDIKSGPGGYTKAAGIRNGGILRRIEESRDLLINGDIPYEFRTTVVDGIHTEEDFRELGPFIKGCRSYFLQAYKESSTVLDLSAGFGTPKKEELLSYAELVSPYVEKVDIRGVD